jgi:excinuclease ABC subunit B
MRHSATRALLERDDVIIVASVSCIYGIGSVETYSAMTFACKRGERIDQRAADRRSRRAAIQAQRHGFRRGTFRVRGDTIEIFPAHYEDRAWRISLFGDEIEAHHRVRPADRREDRRTRIRSRSTPTALRDAEADAEAGDQGIKAELKQRLDELNRAGRCWRPSGSSSAPASTSR